MACCAKKRDGLNEEFHPDYKTPALTEKFYSRYDKMPLLITPAIYKHLMAMEKIRYKDPRCSFPLPRYTNQTYGWLPGYKIMHLQRCTVKLRKTHAYQSLLDRIFTPRLLEKLPEYSDCSCKRFNQRRPCFHK